MIRRFWSHWSSGQDDDGLRANRSICAVVLAAVGTFGLVGHLEGAEAFRPISTRAIGGKPSPLIPKYVSSLSDWGERYGAGNRFEEQDWLLLGLQVRGRVESLDNYYRQPSLPSDEGFYSRIWAYVGIREILDPFRFTIELADARREGIDDFASTSSEMDDWGFLQAYAELYFEDGLFGVPTSFSAGRFSFDAVDRRIIARNRYRNTANAFDGVRLRLGDDKSPWEATLFALRPVRRGFDSFDNESRNSREFYGGYATIRGNSPSLVVEPYWFYLEDGRLSARERKIHTAGVHVFGQFCEGTIDYDFSGSVQWGRRDGEDHFAYAIHAEIGRTFKHSWKPRLAAWINYGSGDGDPNDNDSGRFQELFGAPFGMYGFTRYFTWENTVSPVLSFAFKPTDDVKIETLFRSYFLDSKTDAWVRGLRRDQSGSSGRHVGEEIDIRVRWQATENLLFDTGFAHFIPGGFAEDTGDAPSSTLVYLQARFDF